MKLVSKSATLAQCVQTVIRRHGGLHDTACETNIDLHYLSELASGKAHDPSLETCRRLGIDKTTSYRVRAKVREP